MSIKGMNIAGTSSTRERIKNDYYATPNESTEALLKELKFDGDILEPACGAGHISEVLKKHGYKVKSTDLIQRGYAEEVKDFLTDDFDKVDNVVTNPPFKLAKEFIEKALELANDKVVMFARIQLLEGVSRRSMFDNTPLKYVYVFTKRQAPLRNGSPVDENGKKWASTMCFAWYVWEQEYEGEPIIKWL